MSLVLLASAVADRLAHHLVGLRIAVSCDVLTDHALVLISRIARDIAGRFAPVQAFRYFVFVLVGIRPCRVHVTLSRRVGRRFGLDSALASLYLLAAGSRSLLIRLGASTVSLRGRYACLAADFPCLLTASVELVLTALPQQEQHDGQGDQCKYDDGDYQPRVHSLSLRFWWLDGSTRTGAERIW